MKKALLIMMALVLTLSIIGCGKQQNNEKPAESSKIVSETSQSEQKDKSENAEQISVESIFQPSTSAATGAYATIKISADIKFDDDSAWLGLCPTGKDYITELEADDVDVIWFNADAKENETDPHVFACDFSSVEDGTYALVVATSDDENVGYVVIQLEMTKKGETLTFNYDNAKIKGRPAR